MTTPSDRLKQAREAAGFEKASDAARRLDMHYQTYAAHENGSRGIKVSAARRYAKAFGVSFEWLMLGRGSEKEGGISPVIVSAHEAPQDDVDLIAVYDISASAGDGLIVPDYESVADQLAFPKGYLRHITNTHPTSLAIISVTGNSMAPTLSHDDIVMVDGTKTNYSYDGMYVVRHEGLLRVKRLRRSADPNTIVLKSDNVSYAPPTGEEVVSMNDVEIVGRVVWSGRKEF